MTGHTPTLVMGHIVQFGLADEIDLENGSVPDDEAIIHLKGDEDSEIRVNCPGAPQLAAYIVQCVNSHAELVRALSEIDTLAVCTGVVDPALHERMLSNIARIARSALTRAKAIA